MSIIYEHGKTLRNYNNAAVFCALSPEHAFKSHVLSKFNYASLQNQRRRKPGIRVSIREKNMKMKEIFRENLFLENLEDDLLSQFFHCFFKVVRSGSFDKIIDLNPLELPIPLKYINDDANLLNLFMFPKS